MPDFFATGTGRQVDLSGPPSLLPQYLRAVLPRSGSRPDRVPETVLRLQGIRPAPQEVARYAAVVGEAAADRLPLLYPHLLGFGLQLRLMTDPAFPFPALGLVHVTNELTVTGPLPLDGELDVAVHAGAARPHPRGRLVDLVTAVHCDGRAAWTETSTYLRRGHPAGADGTPSGTTGSGATGSAVGDREAADPGATGSGAGDREAIGSAATDPGAGDRGVGEVADGPVPDGPELHLSARWRLGADLGRRYAAVSGDLNPIHLSALTARPLGFPRAIAHGMWTAAAVLGALQGRLPDALTYTVQFRKPITLPATAELHTGLGEGEIRAQVCGLDGRVHLDARIREL